MHMPVYPTAEDAKLIKSLFKKTNTPSKSSETDADTQEFGKINEELAKKYEEIKSKYVIKENGKWKMENKHKLPQ